MPEMIVFNFLSLTLQYHSFFTSLTWNVLICIGFNVTIKVPGSSAVTKSDISKNRNKPINDNVTIRKPFYHLCDETFCELLATSHFTSRAPNTFDKSIPTGKKKYTTNIHINRSLQTTVSFISILI